MSPEVARAPAPEEVSGSLRNWLEGRFGSQVVDMVPPVQVSGGFDFWIYAVQFQGSGLPAGWAQPLIVRIPPTPQRFSALERETRLQSWAAEHGYPAPGVVALIEPGEVLDSPVQVVERAPGITMSGALTSGPWRIPRMIERMGALHARLHSLPVPEFASGSDWSLVTRRLHLVHVVLEATDDPALGSALGELERLLPRLGVAAPVLCHGDFHPLNILAGGRDLTVIDWTDAGIGDRHGDVARTLFLFRMAAVAAPRASERAVMRAVGPILARRYLSGYRRHAPVDEDRLRLWLPAHLLHLWAMMLADERELVGPSRSGSGYDGRLAGWARQQFEAALRDATR